MEPTSTLTNDQIRDRRIIKALTIFSIFVCIILSILITIASIRKVRYKTIDNLYLISQDSLKLIRSEVNKQTISIETFTAENNNLFTVVRGKDVNINVLKDIVKQYEKEVHRLNVALAVSDETVMNLYDSLDNVIVRHSNKVDSILKSK